MNRTHISNDDIKNCKITDFFTHFYIFLKLFCLNFVNLTLFKIFVTIYQEISKINTKSRFAS